MSIISAVFESVSRRAIRCGKVGDRTENARWLIENYSAASNRIVFFLSRFICFTCFSIGVYFLCVIIGLSSFVVFGFVLYLWLLLVVFNLLKIIIIVSPLPEFCSLANPFDFCSVVTFPITILRTALDANCFFFVMVMGKKHTTGTTNNDFMLLHLSYSYCVLCKSERVGELLYHQEMMYLSSPSLLVNIVDLFHFRNEWIRVHAILI